VKLFEPLVRNWPLKLLAVLLAFAIWVGVTGENRIVQDFRVPVDIGLPDHLIPGEAPPSTVNVRLRGPETLFRRLDPLPLEVNVDLHEAGPGPRTVLLTPDNVAGVPDGLEVALIEPDRFRLLLDRRVRKVLPVVPAFVGQPSGGFAVYDVRIDPESLEVEGPESRVATLSRLRTDPIHLEGRTSSFSVHVSAVPASPEVRVVDPRLLQAEVDVDTAPASATFDGISVVLAGKVYEGSASPPTVSAILSGPPTLLRGFRSDQLRAVVDVQGLAPRPEPYRLPIRIELLDIPAAKLGRITVKSVSRPWVSVSLTNRRIAP
jgi:YbbR domain-containing protein